MAWALQQMINTQGLGHLMGADSRLGVFDATTKQAPGNIFGNSACDEVVFGVLAEERYPTIEPILEQYFGRQANSESGDSPLRRSIEPCEQAKQA